MGLDYFISEESIFVPQYMLEYQWGLDAIELAYQVILFLQIRTLVLAFVEKKKTKKRLCLQGGKTSRRKIARELRDFCYLLSLPILVNLIPFVLLQLVMP